MNKEKVFLAALILSGNLGIFAQSLTLRLSHVTVSKAMTELRKQSGYSFVFEGGDVDTRRRVTVDAKSVRQAADQILASQDVSYTIQGKSIIVTGRRAQASESPQRTERRETGTRTIRGSVAASPTKTASPSLGPACATLRIFRMGLLPMSTEITKSI